MNHIAQQIRNTTLREDNTLHVVAVVSNPERYHSRYRLARDFVERMRATANVQLHLVEAAHGDRKHELSPDLALRVETNAWLKENFINLGVRDLLPRNWRYVAWVDADVEFRDPHWAQETLHQLQQFAVVQPWSQCADLGPYGNVMATHQSFGCLLQSGERMQRWSGEPYKYGHSGFAWACTRAFWEQSGGLLDCAILGSADHHMAWACVGDAASTIHGKTSAGFRRRVLEWQGRAVRATKGEVGYVAGRIEHAFHGPKSKRFYRERWDVLVEHAFDPDVDLQRDPQGCLYIAGKPGLEADIRKYNRARHEDSIEET